MSAENPKPNVRERLQNPGRRKFLFKTVGYAGAAALIAGPTDLIYNYIKAGNQVDAEMERQGTPRPTDDQLRASEGVIYDQTHNGVSEPDKAITALRVQARENEFQHAVADRFNEVRGPLRFIGELGLSAAGGMTFVSADLKSREQTEKPKNKHTVSEPPKIFY